jgi:hypothetical protein
MNKIYQLKSQKTMIEPKNNETKPVRREQDFQTYVLWKSLPSILRGQPLAALQGLGISDELVQELLMIKNQTEFAEKFKIRNGTLTEWNKKIDENNLLADTRKFWAKKLTSNVLIALYRKAIQEADAGRVRLWYEIVEGLGQQGLVNIDKAIIFQVVKDDKADKTPSDTV